MAEILRKWSEESLVLGGEEKVMKKSTANQDEKTISLHPIHSTVVGKVPKMSHFYRKPQRSWKHEKLLLKISNFKTEKIGGNFEKWDIFEPLWNDTVFELYILKLSASQQGHPLLRKLTFSHGQSKHPDMNVSLLVEYSKVLAPPLSSQIWQDFSVLIRTSTASEEQLSEIHVNSKVYQKCSSHWGRNLL